MDLAQLSSIVDSEVLPSLQTSPWDGTTENLGSLTEGVYFRFLMTSALTKAKNRVREASGHFDRISAKQPKPGRRYRVNR
jgi:hypothetical protein